MFVKSGVRLFALLPMQGDYVLPIAFSAPEVEGPEEW